MTIKTADPVQVWLAVVKRLRIARGSRAGIVLTTSEIDALLEGIDVGRRGDAYVSSVPGSM